MAFTAVYRDCGWLLQEMGENRRQSYLHGGDPYRFSIPAPQTPFPHFMWQCREPPLLSPPVQQKYDVSAVEECGSHF